MTGRKSSNQGKGKGTTRGNANGSGSNNNHDSPSATNPTQDPSPRDFREEFDEAIEQHTKRTFGLDSDARALFRSAASLTRPELYRPPSPDTLQRMVQAAKAVQDRENDNLDRMRRARDHLPRNTTWNAVNRNPMDWNGNGFTDTVPQGYARHVGNTTTAGESALGLGELLFGRGAGASASIKRSAEDLPDRSRAAKRSRQATVEDDEVTEDHVARGNVEAEVIDDSQSDYQDEEDAVEDDAAEDDEDAEMEDDVRRDFEREVVDLTADADGDEQPDFNEGGQRVEEEEEDLYNSTPEPAELHDRYVKVHEINGIIGLMMHTLQECRRRLINQEFNRNPGIPPFPRGDDDNDDDDDNNGRGLPRTVLENGFLRRADANQGPTVEQPADNSFSAPNQTAADQNNNDGERDAPIDASTAGAGDGKKKLGGAHKPYSWEETRAMYDVWDSEKWRESSHDEKANAVDALLRQRGYNDFPRRGGNAQRIEWRQLQEANGFTKADLETSRMGRTVYIRNKDKREKLAKKKADADKAKKGEK